MVSRKQIIAAALALAAVVAVPIGAGAQTPEKRVALVIGNDAYQTLPQLVNATSDARDLGRALEAAGFETTVKTNVKRRELYQLIDAFAARIAGSPDMVGLFYYAGHGIQTNGKNYLVPVDANLTSEADLEAEAVDAGKVLRAMDEAHNRINIVILDACRDNPLPKGRSLARGLTSIRAPRGTFIGYAAAPGQTAQDGEPGQNGVFTGTLIKHLGEPGLQLEEVFKRVIAGVSERTGGKQLPWMESSVQGNFYFVGPNAAGVTAGAASPRQAAPSSQQSDADIVFWQSIPRNATATDYEEYLRQFPQGVFAGLARNRLLALRSPPAGPSPSPAPPSADEELTFWKTTMAGGTAGNFEEYLKRYPQGRFSDIARYQIAALRPPPPPTANCGGYGDAQIIQPITLLYKAINKKDIDLYGQQLADDIVYRNHNSGKTFNKAEKLKNKRDGFRNLKSLNITMDKSPDITVNKATNRAEVRVTYSMTYTTNNQTTRTQNGIVETYVVSCYPNGKWLVIENIDEISAAGPPHPG